MSMKLRALRRRTKEDIPMARALSFIILLALVPPLAHAGSTDGYEIKINLPAAAVNETTLAITIPVGMIFDTSSLQISGAVTSAPLALSSQNDGHSETVVTINFGDVNNSADADILVRFKSLVADIEEVHNGLKLDPVRAKLQYRSSDGTLHQFSGQMKPVNVVEPALQIRRSFSPASGRHGDIITCNMHISHSPASTSDAYDVLLHESPPDGLVYVPGSMQILNGPEGIMNSSGGLSWGFSDLNRSGHIDLQYKAEIDGGVDANLTATAALGWTSTPGENPYERSYSTVSEGRVNLSSPPPALNITIAGYPATVSPGGDLTYTISYKNSGGDALGATIKAIYDAGTEFISADPAPDEGTTDLWTLGDMLPANSSGTIKIAMRVNSSLPDGTVLCGSATISCPQSTARDSVFTKVLASTPSLLIEKTASNETIRPGGTLQYTISYKNNGTVAARNVTVTDIVDSNLLLGTTDSQPGQIWQDGEGTHLLWNASQALEPGESGVITLNVSLPAEPQHPDFDWVYNRYKIDSNESSGEYKTLQTAVIHSLYIRKSVENEAYGTGELVNYTLYYGNDLVVDLINAVITDVLPDTRYMEYEGADPQPSSVQGDILTWNIGELPAKSSGVIHLYASTTRNRSTINYRSTGSVSGKGFVNFDQRLDTSEEPHRLTNYANITARLAEDPNIVEHDSSSASIILSESYGTALSIAGHGSGTYSREEESTLQSANKTISSKTELHEQYHPTTFSLGGRSIGYNSMWSESQSAKNRVTAATMSERYMYANRIDRESSVHLDKNGSIIDSQTSFEGAGHIGMQKWPAGDNSTYYDEQEIAAHNRGTPVYESQEDYIGSFNVTTHFDEYGKNAELSRSAAGEGYAASNKRVGESQGSFESGTGRYGVEEMVQTASSHMAKDINVSAGSASYNYTPSVNIHLYQKWSEGTWTSSGPYHPGSSKASALNEPDSFIGERFSSADYLNKSTVVVGLSQMKTEADFQGRAEFDVRVDAEANDSEQQVALYQEYAGRYNIRRNVDVSGVARYNLPHITVTKSGKLATTAGSLVDYTITVTNDGNRALGPVYVQDLFPAGAEYVYSSMRPSAQNASSARWTLLSLGIGASTTIDLRLNMTAGYGINRVQADGGYDGEWVSSQNYSTIEGGWLSCCPPQIWADMTAEVAPEETQAVRYSITLKNRANYVMAATVTCNLGGELALQSSSPDPARYNAGQAVWNIIDLKPGETRSIDYVARALHSGSIVSSAHIEVHALDGSGEAQADVAARVDICGPPRQTSGWQPPGCFGLNCTQQMGGGGVLQDLRIFR